MQSWDLLRRWRERTEETYKALAQKAKDPALKEVLEALSEEEGKNHALMMKSAPGKCDGDDPGADYGLNQEDYEIDLRPRDRWRMPAYLRPP